MAVVAGGLVMVDWTRAWGAAQGTAGAGWCGRGRGREL